MGNLNHGLEHDIKSAYVQQWNFGLQRELPGNLLIEAAYVGSHGVHISDFNSYNFDQMPDQYLSLGNSLFNTYPNPFLGIVPANTAPSRKEAKPLPLDGSGLLAPLGPPWVKPGPKVNCPAGQPG